jgi:hypothetical protein
VTTGIPEEFWPPMNGDGEAPYVAARLDEFIPIIPPSSFSMSLPLDPSPFEFGLIYFFFFSSEFTLPNALLEFFST